MRKETIEIPFLKKYSPVLYFKGERTLIIKPQTFPSSIYNIYLYSKDASLKTIKHFSLLNDKASEIIDISGFDALRISRSTWGLKCTAEVILLE